MPPKSYKSINGVMQTMKAGSLTSEVNLLAAQTTTGYGTPATMGGFNNIDFHIKGAGLTALTVNFYKASPSGGMYPCLASKVDSGGNIALAVSTSALPTAATLTGAATPSTDIHTATSPTFQIAVDGDVGILGTPSYQPITLSPSGLTTGALIAAAMQTAIQALGGIYAAVTVTFTGSVYVITSGTQGASSKVRVAAGVTNDIATALKTVSAYPYADGAGETWTATVPAGWSFQLGVSVLTGTSVTAYGTVGVA